MSEGTLSTDPASRFTADGGRASAESAETGTMSVTPAARKNPFNLSPSENGRVPPAAAEETLAPVASA
jgi:hypothetical protein